MANRSNLPEFLKAIPRWHPGAWGPPAETITLASVVVAGLAAASLFRNELVRALFKFQFNPAWLSAIATAIAGAVAWAGSKRPGSKGPRIWTLLIALFSFYLMVWAIYSRFFPGSNLENPAISNPRLHALSAVGFMAALTLVARLFHVHPYSKWVWNAAPLSLALVLLVCLPTAFWAEGVVEQTEKQQLETKKDRLKKIEKCVQQLSSLSNACRIQLEDDRDALPTRRDWETLALLDRHDRGDRLQAMVRALDSAFQQVVEALGDTHAPTISEPQSYATDANKTNWYENRDFQGQAERAADYFRRISQLHKDIGTALQTGPQEGSPSPANAQAQENPEAVWERTLQNENHLNKQWIPALINGADTPLQTLMESNVGNTQHHLGDVEYWGRLSRGSAHSLLSGSLACSPKIGPLPRIFPIGKEPAPQPPPVTQNPQNGAAPSSVPQPSQQPPIDYYQRYKETVDCYGYRLDSASAGLMMLAEIHLVYEWRDEVRGRNHQIEQGSMKAPHIYLFFDVPPGAKNDDYQHQVMSALAAEAGKGARLSPTYLPGQASYDRGFVLGSHQASCSRITRNNRTTILAEY